MFERCLYFNTLALARKLNAHWEAAFKEYDLPPSQAYLVRLVLHKPGLSQQQIASEMHLDKSTLTRFINALESKQLLKRMPARDNLKIKRIVPTPKAEKLEREFASIGDTLYAQMCDSIGQADLQRFVDSARGHIDRL